MEFFNVVRTRKSIRKFKQEPVGEEILRQILEATNQAPSAGNLQSFEIYIVSEKDQRLRLSKAALDQEFIAEAPLVLIFCANPGRLEWKYRQRGVSLYSIQDATIACTYAMLAATALGFGSVWVGAFHEEEVRDIINAPEGEKPVALLPIGNAAEIPSSKGRRKIDDFIHYL